MSTSRSVVVRLLVTPSIARLWTPKTSRIRAVPFGVSETNRVRRSSAQIALEMLRRRLLAAAATAGTAERA